MRHYKLSKDQKMDILPLQTSRPVPNGHESVYTPPQDEVAKKAYIAYENERSQPGHDIDHWLKAEAELIAIHNLTGVPGFYDRK